MRISTALSMIRSFREKTDMDVFEALRRAEEAGFDTVDIGFSANEEELNSTILSADWQKWVGQVAADMKKRHMHASQSHAVFWTAMKNWAADESKYEEYIAIINRCVQVASMLEIPWIVVHPICAGNTYGKTLEETIDMNLDFFHRFEKSMVGTGTGIAIENLFVGEFQSAEHLLLLQTRLDQAHFGLCWDTGHANITRQMQAQSIQLMGNRLKATHINDNRAVQDEHVLPFGGTVDWRGVVQALKTSGYAGDFTYETAGSTRLLPLDLQPGMMKYAHSLGEYLLAE